MSIGKMLCQISFFWGGVGSLGLRGFNKQALWYLPGYPDCWQCSGNTVAPCLDHKPWTLSKTGMSNISSHGSRSASYRESKQLFSTPSTVPGQSKSGTWNRTHTHTRTCAYFLLLSFIKVAVLCFVCLFWCTVQHYQQGPCDYA